MGVTAARLLAVVPRALGTSVIAVPRQRAPLDTVVGRVVFVTRAVEQLDAQRVETELSTGLTTTAEQTLLDLADRPELGGLSRHEVVEAIQRLAEGVDWGLVGELAVVQRKRPAAMQAAGIAGVRPPVTASRPPRPWGVSPRRATAVIGRDQLRRWVDHYGTPVSQVQRDHLLSHVLARLPDLVPGATFFGGTALCRTHLLDWRLSEDIDLLVDDRDATERGERPRVGGSTAFTRGKATH